MSAVTRRVAILGLAWFAVLAGPSSTAWAQRPPVPYDDPSRVQYGSSTFKLPDASNYASDLGEGLTAFIAEDPGTATVELTALIGASRLDDPAGKEGLADAIGFAMSTAGPAGMTPDTFRQKLRAMDARLSVVVDNEHTRLTIALLKEDLDDGLALLVGLLRTPLLDVGVRDRYVQRGVMRRWDPDDPRGRAEIEFQHVLYGDHPAGRRATAASLQALTEADLVSFHRTYYVPNNVVLAVSGGVSRVGVVSMLRQRLAGWKRSTVTHAAVAAVSRAAGRTIHAFNEHTIQGWLVVGHLGVQGRAQDRPALEIANYILGGGGAVWKRVHAELSPAVPEGHYYARLFNETRSKRGLTNDTSSYVPVGFRVATPIFAVSSGRPESLAPVLAIIDREWRRIPDEVTEADIEIAKQALTEGYFQMRYAGAHQTALSLAEDRFFDGSQAWAQGYVAAIRGVTQAQVAAAAKRYYRPEDLVAVLVGPLDDIRTAQHPLYKATLEQFGTVVIEP